MKYNIPNILFRLFLTFNSTALILAVYFIKSGITIQPFHPILLYIPNWISYTSYITLILFFTYLSLAASKFLDNDEIPVNSVKELESANDSFLPSYLGYFFVALDIPNYESLFFIYAIIFCFSFFSQTLYFNPIFLIFGYHFYNLTDINDVRIFMVTKKKINTPVGLGFPSLIRINDFTFIDKEKQ